MTSVQQLIEEKAALEANIASAVKAAEQRKKALEEEIARERAAEIERGKAEVEKLMKEYHLTAAELFGGSSAGATKKAPNKIGYLAEIRKMYGNRAG